MKFIEELLITISRTHPSVALLVVLVVTGVLGYSYRVFAEDVDLQSLRNKHDTEFISLNRKIDYGFTEMKLKTVEGQIFQLERLSLDSNGFTERDSLRLGELRSEFNSLSRELNKIGKGEIL